MTDMIVCKGCQILRQTHPMLIKIAKTAQTEPVVNLFPVVLPIRRTFHRSYNTGQSVKNIYCLYDSCANFDRTRVNSASFFRPTFLRSLHVLDNKSLVTLSDIEDFFLMNEVSYRKGHAGFLIDCSQCTDHGSNGKGGSELSLFVDMRTGKSVCKGCGVEFDWDTLKNGICQHGREADVQKPTIFKFNKQNPLDNFHWNNSKAIDENTKVKLSLEFPIGKISPSMLSKFHVRATSKNELLFPFYNITGQRVIGFKIFSSASDPLIVKESEHLSLFGWHLIKPQDKYVILTGSELDSIAITMATGLPSLSLPLGVSTLPPDCLPFLEQFDQISLWFGDEYQAKENLQHFATKLNLSRCSRVMSSTGASLVLKDMGAREVEKLIENRKGMKHNDIISSKDLRDELFDTLSNARANSGVPFQRFPTLNEYLKGHRRGELTIFTGPTGSGKTTLLSELSLDLSLQGVKTLWGSFEIRNVRLANIMIHQLSGIAIENYLDQFPKWSEEFENLPMYFMSYYGSQQTQTVLDTIEYAIYAYDIEHIIIDNMQFMVNINSGDNTFRVMDNAIAAFRKCASKHNVHITLVIHPRKEDQGMMLQTSSVYGSAKATQEADNVIILQSIDETLLQITKNRFSGTTGTIPLLFNPSSLCMSGFHRNAETNMPVLPALKVKKFVRNNVNVKKRKEHKY